MRTLTAVGAAASVSAMSLVGLALPAEAATGYQVKVTCTVPQNQPERQLAPNWCLNYLPDETQTFTATVLDAGGNPVGGVTVDWSDNDPTQVAHFRFRQNPCVTGADGTCSAEFVDHDATPGESTTVRATIDGDVGRGRITFR
jgi:Bacterial Ig-like domain (group 1)